MKTLRILTLFLVLALPCAAQLLLKKQSVGDLSQRRQLGGGELADNGSSSPLFASIGPSAMYDAVLDQTIFAWEGWDKSISQRLVYVSSYSHTSNAFSRVFSTGITNYIEDYHGAPAIVRDYQGFYHVFAAAGAALHYSVSVASNDISSWNRKTDFTGALGYPHPVVVSNSIYLFIRNDAVSDYMLKLFKTSALTNGTATWNSLSTIVSFNTNAELPRVYAGNFELVGNEIWFPAQLSPNVDTVRSNVYFFRYKTTNGAVANYYDTATVAAGSLPVDRPTADANFMVYAHTGTNSSLDTDLLVVNSTNRPYILFGDGSNLNVGPFPIKVAYPDGAGSWTIEASGLNVPNRYDVLSPFMRANDEIEMLYTSVAFTQASSGLSFPVGGTYARATRSVAGSWATNGVVLNYGTRSIGRALPVKSGVTSFRHFITELAQGGGSSYASNGLKLYGWGDGFVSRPYYAPINLTAPSISGNTLVGQVLTMTIGVWNSFPTEVLLYQWKAEGTNIPGATSVTVTLTTNEVGATITASVIASNSVGVTTATSSATAVVTKPVFPLLTRLVAWYDLSESSGQRNDSYTNAYHLSNVNTVTQTNGVGGGQTAAYFINADSDRLNYAADSALGGNSTNWSVCFWAYAEVDTGQAGGWIDCFGNSRGYRIRINTGAIDRLHAGIGTGSGFVGNYLGPSPLVYGTWYNVYVEYNGTSLKGSVNNESLTTLATAACVHSDRNYWRLGLEDQALSGRMQGLGMWTRVLSADERTWLYNSGSAARLYADVSTYSP